MIEALNSRTKVVFVANPNNPTGTLASHEQILELLRRVPPHVLVVMDEAYIEFLDEPLDLLPLIRREEQPNLLLMRTFSKIHGLAGLRLGYGIAGKGLVAALEKVRQPFNINSIAQAGALAALDDPGHVNRTRTNNTAGLKQLTDGLSELKLEIVPSSANFILARAGDGQRVFHELQKRGVIVRPMAGYQLPEWIRISVGTPAENSRCLAALREVLSSS